MGLLFTGGQGTLSAPASYSSDFSVTGSITLASAGSLQNFMPTSSTGTRFYYEGNRATARIRAIVGGTTYSRNFPSNPVDGDVLDFSLVRSGGAFTFDVSVNSVSLGPTSNANSGTDNFEFIGGLSEWTSLELSGSPANTYDFNELPAATTVNDLTGSNDIDLTGSYTIGGAAPSPSISNANFVDLTTTISSITPSSITSFFSDRADVDHPSTLYFTHRYRLLFLARAYVITGDVSLLDMGIAVANNFLSLRDFEYDAAGNTVFTGAQTGYREGPPNVVGTSTPIKVWSYDFTDTAVNGNPLAEGRSANQLQNGLIIAALASLAEAYYDRLPSGSYTLPSGASAGLLSGTYVDVFADLLSEINDTRVLFDGLFQRDRVGTIQDSAGTWDIAGAYYYDTRQNLSVSGLNSDNPRPFNHIFGMMYARLVVSRFSNLDPNGLDDFKRCYSFFESVAKSDDPAIANAGLSGDIFGIQADGSYSWPYQASQTWPEDLDHSIINLDGILLGHRFGVIESRTDLELYYRAVESVYVGSGTQVYDRIHDTSNGFFSGTATISGSANWLSDNTSLQADFATLFNAVRPSGNVGDREYDPILAYHATEQLPELTYTDTTLSGIDTTDSFYSLILAQHGVTLTDGAVISVSGEDVTVNADSSVTFGTGFTGGFYYYTPSGGQRSETYQFGVEDFTQDTTAPVILVSGYSDGDTISLTVGDTFTPPTATATDNVDGAITPTQSGNVNTAVEGSYTHVYTATDTAGNASTFTLNIVVSVPSINFAIAGVSNISLAENVAYISPAPTLSGDAPDGAVTWTLSGNDAGVFTVNSSTGVVSAPQFNFGNAQDANSNNVYELTLTATDSGGNTDSVNYTVTITDADESLTPTVNNFTLSIAENAAQNASGQVLGNVISSNADSLTVTGSIFTISGGQIILSAAQSVGTYTETITATSNDPDSGSSITQTDTATITYIVTDAITGTVDLQPVIDAIAAQNIVIQQQGLALAALQASVNAIPTVDVSGLATQVSLDAAASALSQIPTDLVDLTPVQDVVDTIRTDLEALPSESMIDTAQVVESIRFVEKRHTNRSVYLDALGNATTAYYAVRQVVYDDDNTTVLQTISFVDSQGNETEAYNAVGALTL